MLNVHNLTVNLAGDCIFQNVSFFINEGEKILIAGPNGSGKSTLFNVLAGHLEPEEGNIAINKGATVGLLKQIAEPKEDMTLYQYLEMSFESLMEIQNEMKAIEVKLSEALSDRELTNLLEKYSKLTEIFERNNGYQMHTIIDDVCNGLSISHLKDQPFSSLSGGEKTKAGLAEILIRNDDIILLDEPTNHLDVHAIEWLESFIKKSDKTILFTTHDKTFANQAAMKVLELDDKELRIWPYGFNEFLKKKEEFIVAQFEKYEEQQKKIQKMKESIAQLRDWANRSNPPSIGLHRRANNMEKALKRIEIINKPVKTEQKLKNAFQEAGIGSKDIVFIENGTVAQGSAMLYKNLNLNIKHKDRVGIVGRNGVGKTTLIRCIIGEKQLADGTIKIGENLKIGYIDQKSHVGDSNQTIVQFFKENLMSEEGMARNILAKYGFYGSSVFKKLSVLSGGERIRLKLSILMEKKLNVLILDEPTNHLDIESQEILENSLQQFQGTVICVSHDRHLLEKFNKILWLEDKKVTVFVGPYSYAKNKRRCAAE
ncbi:ribosomal protection-like ABC-F family protein [Bacillus atrophaeus]|uniref:ribosomal protection-like ABC-F family protein n=1 Tax=Bacillus atrophaeus TaxID=1452 RepID=UPI00227F84E8|nr:ABC-F family ATP-binding cassette domain-containing protein [Bacillus atrophaeus]MCY8913289.1 ATP-binding cassette domain-containing protein [Bacillus atrophaeus]MCY9113753.1 ATP-binding cassette domain-containing protein [Bacillus atrophaeus]MEC0766441.1 ABC-F family ATP-binding cassette domain-containing protein [Bacillus atrophaeus]MEC0781141.1 ABC-F family ATP-binding cassette domain-containing protein [Bacillus atrophaeus]MEC0806720.1 ABC-F family ATP-binding cassette domain-containing